jgi:tRNA(fMet)-specific endonuclease VapC
VDRHLSQVPISQLAISTVTEGELRFGIARQPAATRLHALIEDFFLRVAILPWDSEAAQHYGQLRASLERDGRPIGNLDTMIAAHAIAIGATLVTNDRAFTRIKKLKVEDWTKTAQH